MNERIEKLVEQAGIWKPTHDHKTWVRGEYVASPGELEKFAELIVRECVGVCDDERDSTDSEFGKLVAEGCALKIMERFGVEE